MKINDLAKLLEDLRPILGEAELFLASDAEGNDFRPWDGSFSIANYIQDEVNILGEGDDDEDVTCIVIWPS